MVICQLSLLEYCEVIKSIYCSGHFVAPYFLVFLFDKRVKLDVCATRECKWVAFGRGEIFS